MAAGEEMVKQQDEGEDAAAALFPPFTNFICNVASGCFPKIRNVEERRDKFT